MYNGAKRSFIVTPLRKALEHTQLPTAARRGRRRCPWAWAGAAGLEPGRAPAAPSGRYGRGGGHHPQARAGQGWPHAGQGSWARAGQRGPGTAPRPHPPGAAAAQTHLRHRPHRPRPPLAAASGVHGSCGEKALLPEVSLNGPLGKSLHGNESCSHAPFLILVCFFSLAALIVAHSLSTLASSVTDTRVPNSIETPPGAQLGIPQARE